MEVKEKKYSIWIRPSYLVYCHNIEEMQDSVSLT